MRYTIKDIIDNTTNRTRTEELYAPYLGKVCDVYTDILNFADEIILGAPATIEGANSAIRTSKVMDMNTEGDYTYIKTRNSTYVLERINDDAIIL